MLKIFVLVTLVVASLAKPQAVIRNNGPVIETTGGLVEGDTASCGLFCNFFSFKGIPYAAPPVGNLRFSAPVPHPGWTGVRDATEHGNRCPSSGWLADYGGDEDCLFLNVYSRNLIGRRAVMVWIHGGSFTGGHGDTFIYGPDHLMTDDVVVVTINYRLGFLGFFSTGDAAASGNWGLKDAVEALRWVKKNIARFGGDPDNVTIFGESAGGVAVHYLVLSAYANGLYHKAISQSGSALNPWAYQSNPARIADNLAQNLGVVYTSSQNLVDQLRTVHFTEFVVHQPGWLEIDKPRGFSSFDIAPCSEPFANGPVIIDHRTPIEIMQAGDFNDIPYISGYMSDESMFMQREHIIDDDIFRFFNDNPWAMVPELWNIPHSDSAVNEIAAAFRNLYFNGEAPSDDWMEQWTWYTTDHQFIYGIDTTVRMHSERQRSNVYYYRFSYDGDLNLIKRLLLLRFPGAIHADEIPYMFSLGIPDPVLPTNHAITVRRRLIRLWTNFAKYSDPTPLIDRVLQNVVWPAVNGQQQYIDIGEDLVVGNHATGARMAVWNEMRERFANL